MTIWTDLGFRENPYAVTPVPSTEEGDYLLVGRDKEVSQLLMALTSLDTHPTIEGENGVGKTSLVAVAGYRALRQFMQDGSGQLFIPINRTFQLEPGHNVLELERTVMYAVAQAFITHDQLIRNAGLQAPDVGAIDKWLNAPTFRQASGSLAGWGAGLGSQANDGAGFEEAGFREAVTSWLSDCFPSLGVGGFVCVIDNLELLETSQQARGMIEAARDRVLSLPGLRWVLCGARGIVRSAAASPRLQGFLAEPLELQPIPDPLVSEVVARRVSTFRMTDEAYVPVDSDGFDHLYKVMHFNLRNALRYCQDFAAWMHQNRQWPTEPKDKYQLLEIWLAEISEQYEKATKGVTVRGWEVFSHLVEAGGYCSPSDFDEFGFSSQPAMRPYVKQLEDGNLVVSSIDETDQRRRTIGLTPRGRLVQYRRSGFSLPDPDVHA